MELSQEKKTFKIIWKIHNFSMIPYEGGEPLWSPTFVIDLFDGTEWNIGLYVRGYKDENFLTGIAYRGKSDKGEETIPVCLEISFRSVDGSLSLVYEKTYNFGRNNGHGFQLIPRKDILQDKKFLLPGDTLIMECRMWKSSDDKSHTTESIARNLAFDSKFVNRNAFEAMKKVLQPEISECRIRTRVNVEKLRFIWAIPKFSTLKTDQKLSVPICFVGKHSPKFVLSIVPNLSPIKGEGAMHIQLSAESKESFYCSYDIMLVDCDHVPRISMKGDCLFETGSPMTTYNIPNPLKWSEIQRNKHLHLVDETLTMYCKFAVSSSSSVKTFIEETVYSSPKCGVYGVNNAGEDNENPKNYNRGRRFCDVSLHVEEKLLRAHKIILCNKSPVLKTLLEQDLYEECDILDIEDFDADTIDRMLFYMYTQTVEELNWKKTSNLYLAADKYKIADLQKYCIEQLESKVSVSNVCGLLSLADMNNNKELVTFAANFIKNHKGEVLRTVEWADLMENNGALAAKLMHEMFVKD